MDPNPRPRRLRPAQVIGVLTIALGTGVAIVAARGVPWILFAWTGTFMASLGFLVLDPDPPRPADPLHYLCGAVLLSPFTVGFGYLLLERSWLFGIGAVLFGFPAIAALFLAGRALVRRDGREPANRTVLILFDLWIAILAGATVVYRTRTAGPAEPPEMERR